MLNESLFNCGIYASCNAIRTFHHIQQKICCLEIIDIKVCCKDCQLLLSTSICSFVNNDTEHIISQCFHHIIDVLEPKNLSNNFGCYLLPKLTLFRLRSLGNKDFNSDTRFSFIDIGKAFLAIKAQNCSSIVTLVALVKRVGITRLSTLFMFLDG